MEDTPVNENKGQSALLRRRMAKEIEVNFRLDNDGRTTLLSSVSDIDTSSICRGNVDYSTKSILTQFVEPLARTNCDGAANKSLYDELLLDCEICDSALMPRTFWVPAPGSNEDFTPRCTLEQMARDIFEYHTKAQDARIGQKNTETVFDPSTSGAEWWVQLRPSPEKTGRYALFGHESAEDGDGDDTNGIPFHWDKDEDLRLLCGGSIYVHPHLSTVTYLTGIGAPTLIVEGCRINSLTGDWIDPAMSSSITTPEKTEAGNKTEEKMSASSDGATLPKVAAFISWPFKGKHLCFDGRYLHAAPSDLQIPGSFLEQCTFVPTADLDAKVQRRTFRRVTFLVNIWLNHKPFNVHPFPDSMIDKLSGHTPSCSKDRMTIHDRLQISFANNDGGSECKTATVRKEKTIRVAREQTSTLSPDTSVEEFIWPLGDHDSLEVITAAIPVSLVRSQANAGGNVRVHWAPQPSYLGRRERPTDNGLYLIKEYKETSERASRKRRCPHHG
jgi:hypothetical protein